MMYEYTRKMVDLAVGTEFYYKGKLCKVVELEDPHDYYKCSKCSMPLHDCNTMDCKMASRKDGKSVCFKWVETTEEING